MVSKKKSNLLEEFFYKFKNMNEEEKEKEVKKLQAISCRIFNKTINGDGFLD